MEEYRNKRTTMRIERCVLLSVLVFASTAPRAQAQWLATGYLGLNVAGDVEAGKGGAGVSVSYFTAGWDSSLISNATIISSKMKTSVSYFRILGWISIPTR